MLRSDMRHQPATETAHDPNSVYGNNQNRLTPVALQVLVGHTE